MNLHQHSCRLLSASCCCLLVQGSLLLHKSHYSWSSSSSHCLLEKCPPKLFFLTFLRWLPSFSRKMFLFSQWWSLLCGDLGLTENKCYKAGLYWHSVLGGICSFRYWTLGEKKKVLAGILGYSPAPWHAVPNLAQNLWVCCSHVKRGSKRVSSLEEVKNLVYGERLVMLQSS